MRLRDHEDTLCKEEQMTDLWTWLATPVSIARGIVMIFVFVLGAFLAGEKYGA